MRHLVVAIVIIAFCCGMVTPVCAAFDTSPHHYITRYYPYVLDGRQGTISLALSTEVYQEYLGKNPLWDATNAQSYFLNLTNDPVQKPYIHTLADEIRKQDENPDNRARIATNLVQHIPYSRGESYRYPYEVLYEGYGICGEKSMLLASLLRELGFRSSVFYFPSLSHMTTGIGCPAPYDFKGSGYCMIETTRVYIITDETTMQNDTTVMIPAEGGWGKPDITELSEGRSLDSARSDYYDSRLWIHMISENMRAQEEGQKLSSEEYAQFYQLKNKYDLS